MLIDFLSQDNYNQYNIGLAHLIGLENAVYLNELLNIYQKAVRKKKYTVVDTNNYNEDNREVIYFSVDRKYIEERTTLTIAKQLASDIKLIELNIMKKSSDDEICIDIEYLTSIFADKNKKVVKNLVDTVKPKKDTKKDAVAEAIKFALKCDDKELYELYKAWVDAVLSNPKAGVLSTAMAKAFRDSVVEFCNGNRGALVEIIRIATIQGWKTPAWAIENYKSSHKIHKDCTKLSAPVSGTTTISNSDIFDVFN